MDEEVRKKLLAEQLQILDAACAVLMDSRNRVRRIFKKKTQKLSVQEKESCEALTARFARLCDFLFQRVFRTLDRIELQDEGTGIDRLNRMEKRGIISSSEKWKVLRELRNDIAHEYLIEKSDQVLKDCFQHTPELLETAENFKAYVGVKRYV